MDTATYNCGEGFGLSGGDRVRTCVSSVGGPGEWNGTAPTCEVITCTDPPSLTNGTISFSSGTASPYDYGTTATYECSTGFELVGDASRVCSGDGSSPTGSWSGSDPVCEVVCGDLIPNCAMCSGQPVTCTECSSGYSLRGGACTLIECSELSVSNGSFDYSNGQSLGSAATLTCATGYTVDGANPVTCQESGEWSGTSTCEPVCSALIPNCLTCSTSGQTVTCILCFQGYLLMDGLCTPIECDELNDAVQNGIFSYSLGQPILQSVATLSCDANFVVFGISPVVCQDNGEWSGLPTCEPVCSDLIPNCILCSRNDENTIVCTDCLPEHQPADGVCVPIECEPLIVANGDFEYTDGQSLGSMATLTCVTGFVVSGTNPVTCGASGEWSGTSMCEPDPENFNCDVGCIIGLSVLGVAILIMIIVLLIVTICLIKGGRKKASEEEKNVTDSIKLEDKEVDVFY